MKLLLVDIAHQVLYLSDRGRILQSYSISTAKKGVGQSLGSYQTPEGWHVISETYGEGEPPGMIFIGRQPTGDIVSEHSRGGGDDPIVSRILRLKGLEKGLNVGKGIDSHERLIYIHGTAPGQSMGVPASQGCIRMDHQMVVMLFDHVSCGDRVFIHKNLESFYTVKQAIKGQMIC